jgi:hypothetical protein
LYAGWAVDKSAIHIAESDARVGTSQVPGIGREDC